MSFNFDDDFALDHIIGDIKLHRIAFFVDDGDRELVLERKPRLSKCNREDPLICVFSMAGTEVVVHMHASADNSVCHISQTVVYEL